MTFQELKRQLKKDLSNSPVLKLAVVGDTATQLLSTAIKGYAYAEGINLDVFDADFNQLDEQLFDRNSQVYLFNPGYILVFMSTHALYDKFCKLDIGDKSTFAESMCRKLLAYWECIKEYKQCHILQYTFVEIDDRVFGNYGSKLEHSFIFQLRKLNYLLAQSAVLLKNLYLIDLSGMQNWIGRERFFDDKIFYAAKMAISVDALPIVAKGTIDVVKALNGAFKKCLVLDLDNTLWGGVIGDDGLSNIELGELGRGHVFSDFQHWLKQLKERGVLLAVCSKNDETIAKEPFEAHPDMVIRLEDISLFVANWEDKAKNIRYIQSQLNIGMDSLVFVDDNPFERNLVRSQIPDIEVPELPEDPSQYLAYLQEKNYFEAASFSHEDTQRTSQYRAEIKRTDLQKQYYSIDEYLISLEMEAEAKPFASFQIPRIAQLTQRSNQFNLRTRRYSEADIFVLAESEKHLVFYFTLKDKFGDHGLISAVILEKRDSTTLFVDTWIMSCRVLKRGVEEFIMNKVVQVAKANNYMTVIGEYLRTQKNGMVSNIYSTMGFEKKSDTTFVLDVGTFIPHKNYIKEI
jgi:FkbH-like protein